MTVLSAIHRMEYASAASMRSAMSGRPITINDYPGTRAEEALLAAARAGGIPEEWITQVSVRGYADMPLHPNLAWRTPVPIERRDLLAALAGDMWRLQEMAALTAAQPHGVGPADGGDASARMLDRRLHAERDRAVAVGSLLEVTAAEAQQYWGRTHFVAAAAAGALAVDPAVAAERWANYTTGTSWREDQAVMLQTTGIHTQITEPLLPPAQQLVQGIRQHLTPPASAAEPGFLTATAIDAALPAGTYSIDPDTAPPPEPPRFQEPASELEP